MKTSNQRKLKLSDPDTVSDEILPEYRFNYSKARPNRFAELAAKAAKNERKKSEGERETAYLVKSETMKRRLLEAKQRQGGISLAAVCAKLNL